MPRQPTGRLEQLVFSGLLVLLASALIQGEWLWRWDQLLFDVQLRQWTRPAPDDVVIVEIDEASLAVHGRWPWPRTLHAELIDKLVEQGARAIALDIIFAEPDRNDSDADRRLAEAVKSSGRTVLPVLAETHYPSGQLIEQLPVPALSEAAARLGHVHVELDRDGIARSVYLKEGLGDAHWPMLALAMLEVAGLDPKPLPGLRAPARTREPTRSWVRDYHVRVPFAGPPNHFARVSYTQVIRGQLPDHTLKDKLVLVGMTAAGMGDALPTPVSGHNHFMAGVEFNANVLDALRRGITIRDLPRLFYFALTCVLVLAPMFIYPRVAPRWSLAAAVSLIAATMLFSSITLRLAHIWFPPAAALVVITLSYPLWSWWRLAKAMGYLDRELARLNAEHESWLESTELPIEPTVAFTARMLGATGWRLNRVGDSVTVTSGESVEGECPQLSDDMPWIQEGEIYWARHAGPDGSFEVGFRLPSAAWLEPRSALVMESFTRPVRVARTLAPRGSMEVMQSRIDQVQQATDNVRAVRAFIDQSLSQMADGVLVASPRGRVRLANHRASLYLRGDPDASLVDGSVLELLHLLSFEEMVPLERTVRSVLLERAGTQLNARNHAGLDLLVQLSPLEIESEPASGLIINLSDISLLKESERKRSEVLGFLSHDIRSPLVSILALVELADRRQSEEALKELLQRTGRYANKTLKLAEQLLELARAENSEHGNWTDFDLLAVANNAFEQVWSLAQSKRIQLTFDSALEEAWINGDPDLVERAIVNLLTNAIKYSDKETAANLEVRRSTNGYECCVVDQGMGIADDDVPHLFDRFRRLGNATTSNEGGVGLGLAFVKAVAESHGGAVEVRSTVNEGSSFRLELPADPERTAA